MPRPPLVARLTRRTGRDANQNVVAIDEGKLLRDRDDDGDRTLRRPFRVPEELAWLKCLDVLADAVGTLRQGRRHKGAPTGKEAHT